MTGRPKMVERVAVSCIMASMVGWHRKAPSIMDTTVLHFRALAAV